MKQGFLKISVAFLALLLVGGGAFLLWPRDRITEESWEEIHLEMSEREVEEILGGCGISDSNRIKALEDEFPDKEAVLRGIKIPFITRELGVAKRQFARVWIGRRAFVKIEFDQNGHVSGKTIFGYERADAAFLGRLRDWLGW